MEVLLLRILSVSSSFVPVLEQGGVKKTALVPSSAEARFDDFLCFIALTEKIYSGESPAASTETSGRSAESCFVFLRPCLFQL